MKAVLLLFAALFGAAFPVTAQQAAMPNKLPVAFSVKANDPVGQRVGFNVRELLRRASAMTLVAENQQAWMWFDFLSIKADDASTSYSLVIGINDRGAWTGSSYWSNVVGFCGVDRTESCAKNLMAYIDQAVVDFQAEFQRRQAQQQQPQQSGSPSSVPPKK